MQKLMHFSHTHPRLVLPLVFLISLFAAFQIPKLRHDPSLEGMTVSQDPARDVYEETVKIFGSDKIVVVFVRDDHLFTPSKLKRLEDLVYELEELPGVDRVESLFSATRFAEEDGALHSSPLLDWIPETEEESLLVMQNALAHPLVLKTLISAQGDATAINLFLETGPSDPLFYQEFAQRADRILATFEGDFQRMFPLGNPYFKTAISSLMLKDQKRLVPFSLIVLLLTLMLITRSPGGAALPLITAGTSTLWTVGFMSLTGIPLNLLTIIIPSLIIVIGSTEDIHLLSEYLEGLHQGKDRHSAVQFMIRKMGTVITVTALTTFFGFLSICINQIPIMRQFGMAAAFGLLVNPLITALLTPLYFRFMGTRNPKKPPKTGGPEWLQAAAGIVTSWVTTRRKTVLSLSFGVIAVITLFSPWVRLNNDILGVFKKDSTTIRNIDEMSRHLAGVQCFYIRINGGHKEIFKDPRNLAQVAGIQEFIQRQGRFDTSLSLVDVLGMVHRGMEGDHPTSPLPETRERVSQYLLFLTPQDTDRFVSSDFSEVNIIVRHNLHSSHEQQKAIDELKAFIDKTLNPHFTYFVTGESILTLRAADAMAEGQAKSILLLLAFIFIIMSFMFVNLKAGMLSLVPNILPVGFAFGLMGLLGIPLNIGTAMVAVIAIGIALDDTLHFMIRYNTEMRRMQSQEQAIAQCIRAEMLPAFSSSAALSLGFAVLAFSGFVSIIHFGLISAAVMVVAFLSDLFVTPALLSMTRLLTLWDMIGLRLRREVVERSEFFRDLRPWQMKKIILLGRIQDAGAGEVIFREWDEGESMFLLLKGEVQVYGVQEETGQEILYNLLLPGDIFGQIAMLEPGPRSAHVRAKSDVTYVEINREDFERLQKMYPRIAAKAFRNMARILGHQLVVSSWRYKEKMRE